MVDLPFLPQQGTNIGIDTFTADSLLAIGKSAFAN